MRSKRRSLPPKEGDLTCMSQKLKYALDTENEKCKAGATKKVVLIKVHLH